MLRKVIGKWSMERPHPRVRVRVRIRVRVLGLGLGSGLLPFFSVPPFQFLLLSWKRVGMSRKFSVLPDITGKQETHKVDPRL